MEPIFYAFYHKVFADSPRHDYFLSPCNASCKPKILMKMVKIMIKVPEIYSVNRKYGEGTFRPSFISYELIP